MSDSLRYRVIDEPRPNMLQRLALPPLLVFLVAQFFLPWGALLVALNAIALNGPHRNREILFAMMPIVMFFGGIVTINLAVRAGLVPPGLGNYLFVAAIGIGLMFIATAFVSQQNTADLRTYLREQG